MLAKYHSQLDDYLKSVLLRRRRSVGEYQDYRDYPEQGERLLANILKTTQTPSCCLAVHCSGWWG